MTCMLKSIHETPHPTNVEGLMCEYLGEYEKAIAKRGSPSDCCPEMERRTSCDHFRRCLIATGFLLPNTIVADRGTRQLPRIVA